MGLFYNKVKFTVNFLTFNLVSKFLYKKEFPELQVLSIIHRIKKGSYGDEATLLWDILFSYRSTDSARAILFRYFLGASLRNRL